MAQIGMRIKCPRLPMGMHDQRQFQPKKIEVLIFQFMSVPRDCIQLKNESAQYMSHPWQLRTVAEGKLSFYHDLLLPFSLDTGDCVADAHFKLSKRT